MTQTITVPAPAKLNLFLHITSRRTDGYHELQSIFQFVTLSDQLEFTLGKSLCSGTTPNISIQVDASNSQFTAAMQEMQQLAQEENIIFKACQSLLPYASTPCDTVIKYQKNIPSGAGMGGGSSNAATTLLTLNKVWNCNLDMQKLADIGLTLGADVPIFILGKTAFAEGVGEKLTPVTPRTPYYLIIKPQVHINTAEIFSHPDLTRNTPTLTISAALEQGGHNDCENIVRSLYPEVDSALKWLGQFKHAQLTGTGACIFAEFDSLQQAQDVAKQYSDPSSIFIAQGMNENPAHRVLLEQLNA